MRETKTFDIPLSHTKRDARRINIFWAGISIYILGFVISRARDLNYIFFQAFQTVGIVLIIATSIHLIKSKIENQYLRILYILYCSWNFIVVLLGSNFRNYNFIKYFLFHLGLGGIIYFAPLALLLPKTLLFYKKVFNVIIVFAIFYIAYDIFFIQKLLNPNRTSLTSVGVVELSFELGLPAGFLLLTYSYHSNKKLILALGVTLLAILFAIIRARRGSILMLSSSVICAYVLYLISSKTRFIILYLTILIALLTGMYVSQIYKPDESIFGHLLERGDEDTRTDVEVYFYSDMNTKDWLVGKGLNGEYLCPDIEEGQVTNYRNVIETGYLQIVLKTGLVGLILLLLIAIPAIIHGFFHSNNILSKAAAIWILMSMLSLYPTIVNTFSLRYLLVWISIGICYSKNIRTIPENEMREYFRSI